MNRLQKLLKRFELHSLAKWILLASLVGVVAGLGAIVFDVLGQAVVRYSLTQFAGYRPLDAAGEYARFHYTPDFFTPWMIVAVMTVGGLISGILVYSIAPEAEGAGTDAAIDA
ncbi:MAG: chloride channel protein, partial [Planctomycetales bacterium]|nr:chloride channel protein [Planctomycetales bacterium]